MLTPREKSSLSQAQRRLKNATLYYTDTDPNTLPLYYTGQRSQHTHYHCITQDSHPNTLPLYYTGQPSQHTTTVLHRTAIPTHYHCITQDTDPNTLPLYYTGQPSQHTTTVLHRTAIPTHYHCITQDTLPLYNTGQPSQHTTTVLHRTPIPTHYALSYPGPILILTFPTIINHILLSPFPWMSISLRLSFQ